MSVTPRTRHGFIKFDIIEWEIGPENKVLYILHSTTKNLNYLLKINI